MVSPTKSKHTGESWVVIANYYAHESFMRGYFSGTIVTLIITGWYWLKAENKK